MKNNEKKALMDDLMNLGSQGVKFFLEGEEVYPEDELVSLLLAEDGCTYMRNYVFQGKQIVEVEFDKIKLI